MSSDLEYDALFFICLESVVREADLSELIETRTKNSEVGYVRENFGI
jgi:hypothetical protein